MPRSAANLAAVLKKVRRHALRLAEQAWPGLAAIANQALPDPMDPVALLPVITGLACGAAMDELIPVASTVVTMAVSLRILDDCADQDNPHALYLAIGEGRATHAAAALSAVAARTLLNAMQQRRRGDALVRDYLDTVLRIYQGQDDDLRSWATNLAEYQAVVENKTVAAYAFAATAGARIATTNRNAIDRCQECGIQIGWMTQILDDIEALWFLDESNDLRFGRLTFPVFYGLSLDHSRTRDLVSLCQDRPLKRDAICALLDEMNVRHSLMAQALDHRDCAIAALGARVHPQGLHMLRTWLDWKFRDGQRLLSSGQGCHPGPCMPNND